MPKQTKTRRATKPAAELPAWVTETPRAQSYELNIFNAGGDTDETINDLTRSEYISLKLQLARMRGYAVPEVADV